jgi:phosphoribosylaminoimidazole-succinocarboxamide synthase
MTVDTMSIVIIDPGSSRSVLWYFPDVYSISDVIILHEHDKRPSKGKLNNQIFSQLIKLTKPTLTRRVPVDFA